MMVVLDAGLIHRPNVLVDLKEATADTNPFESHTASSLSTPICFL
jgi:hypothetical protein